MKHRLLRAFTALPVAGLLVTLQPAAPTITAHALSYSQLNTIQKRILSGFASTEATGDDSANAAPNNYFPRGSDACPVNLSSNIKVNQNCLNISDPDLQGRAQAQNETSVAINPMDTNDLIASYNDYRRGDGNCYGAYSVDNGRNWNDTTIPMGFTRGTHFGGFARQYWQAGGDTSVAWDTKGNAYFDCQVFERGRPPTPNPDLSSAFYVFRSTQNHGASWNFPGRPVTESADLAGTGVPAFEDKPYMTVDNHVGSPNQDRVYVTWTEFRSTGAAYIFEAYSKDYGETFSPPVLVSINAPTLCPLTFGAGTELGNCNENQFSQPFTAPDGTLYVVYDNFNNAEKIASDDRNQILLSISHDGGASFAGPFRIADYYDLPDCATYQAGKDFGRACVPEKGGTSNSIFRAANYPSGSVNPANPNQVVVTFGSYINVHSNEANGCVPAGVNPATGNNLYTGVKAPGACNNDILETVSNDGGATWTGQAQDPRVLAAVTQDSGQATTDQWWQWQAFTKNGKLAVSYYDRQYGDDETTGFSDDSLSGSGDLINFKVLRVTSSSMPPPTQFGGVFLGDYNAVDAVNDAHPVWMDTRVPDLFICPGTATATTPPAVCTGSASNASIANDQDIFTANLPVPSK
ncbi:MAG TPA: exo-alpha-sialidase [Candidatus Dormibacteraeota bacterium]|nr:exo-alpha-sialidase [Candidatus Dormibacteraeota bacterium]